MHFRNGPIKGNENDLDFFVNPAMPLYWDITEAWESASNQPPERKIENIVAVSFGLLFYAGAIAFECQAHYLLQRHPSSNRILWLISVCVTAFCFILAYIYTTVSIRGRGSRGASDGSIQKMAASRRT